MEVQLIGCGVLAESALDGLVKVRDVKGDQTKEEAAAVNGARKAQIAEALQLVLGRDDQGVDARPQLGQLLPNVQQQNLPGQH